MGGEREGRGRAHSDSVVTHLWCLSSRAVRVAASPMMKMIDDDDGDRDNERSGDSRQDSLSVYLVPGAVISTSPWIIAFVITPAPRDWCSYPHFRDRNTEAQKA